MQRSIAALFAGLRNAVTQPIRINDVVLVGGEYGNIEEITLTYVVVKIWDQRRLLVPVTYFPESLPRARGYFSSDLPPP